MLIGSKNFQRQISSILSIRILSLSCSAGGRASNGMISAWMNYSPAVVEDISCAKRRAFWKKYWQMARCRRRRLKQPHNRRGYAPKPCAMPGMNWEWPQPKSANSGYGRCPNHKRRRQDAPIFRNRASCLLDGKMLFQMAVYFATIGWQSTSKHGILISWQQNALVRVYPKTPTNLLKVYLIAIIESVINVKIVWKSYEA